MPAFRHVAALGLAIAASMVVPALATAQTGGAGRTPKWEIEVHGGGAIAAGPAGGTVAALPEGEPLTTGAGFPSLRIASWLVGDGAVLFNSASALAGRAERITALDQILNESSARRRSGAAIGFRISRVLTSKFDAEFGLDYASSGLALSDDTVSRLETTRQTFVTAFNGFFGSSPAVFGNRTTTAVASLKKSGGQRLFVSGGIVVHLSDTGARPYLVGGVAMARSLGAGPTAGIATSYKFTALAATTPFTIEESGELTIRYAASSSPLLGMAGGGFSIALTPTSGIRFDARVFLGNDRVETVVDAQGAPHDSDPAGAVYTFTSPAIQWSSNQQGVGRSSFSGTVTGFRTLSGTNFQAPVIVTAGYFFRF